MQLQATLPHVLAIANNADAGCDGLRTQLQEHLTGHMREITLEFALLEDAARPLVLFCYEYESDGFNAPLLFDRWTAVVRQGQQCQTVAPRVQARCEHYEPNNVQARNTLFRDTVHKSLPAYDKLRSDSTGRLELQHRTSRACRLLGFAFVAVQPLQGLLQELVHLSLLPHVAPHLAALEEELPAYRELAIAALTDSDVPNPPPDALWEFWRRHALSLPCWYEAAAEVALIMTSSASVERLFSLYTSLFTDEQANALEDYRETALMLRFNLRQREKEQ